MKSSLVRLITIVTAAALAGCSLGAPVTKSITIVPSAANADVYVDGNLIGTGTQTVDMATGRAHSVMAQCGDSAGTGTVTRRLSGYGVADIIGGLLLIVPFIGFTADGAWTLDPETLNVAIPDASGC